MDFLEVIEQARNVLQKKERITYRTLKRQFALDDEALEDLKEQLIDAERVAIDEEGRILVWAGDGTSISSPQDNAPQPQPPVSYTPQHLAERILAEQAAMESRGSVDGERKTITALFADLKGSTALIEGLDPEEARAIIDPALQLMMDAVHRYEGYVAQALGDGIFALFGAPLAHEDHPQRALYAALRMQEDMRHYGDQVRLKHGVPLQMRVGVNTGEVVVRSIRKDDLHTDYVPVGHSTNLAARMEQMATPGSVVISEYTRKLTEGYFELKALGAATIKGVEEPLNVYEVLGAGPLRSRFQVTARRGLTRFVGRHSELDQMRQALEQAKAGHGQIVGVMGEPGLGKSRLFYEFKLTSLSGCLVLEAYSVSHGKASPYLPIIELLKDYFQIEPTDDERARRAKVMGQVLALDKSLEATLPYLLSVLGIDDPESTLHQMDGQIRRQRTFAALKKLFLRESLNQPLILVFEDLHWIDTETQGFLDIFVDSVASTQVLLLVNYRPEYRHEWGGKTYYTQLRLTPLGTAEADELLTFLLGTDPSLDSLKPFILERTDGTPFFIEEVVQTLAEEGALRGQRGKYQLEAAPTELHLSPTVQGILAARIDRLVADEKELLQQLSVIGRQFPVSLIKHVVGQAEDALYGLLAALQAKEFLYEQPAFPEVEYVFKHALTQEVAYGTVLQEQRKTLHERTGRALEVLYRANIEDHYSTLAHHYSQSANAEKAVEYLGLAGQQAVQHSAYGEATRLMTTALALLQTLPDTPQRNQKELPLQIMLGASLQAIRGFAVLDVEHAYTRARELCGQMEASVELAQVLYGLFQLCIIRPKIPAAHEIGEQLLGLSQRAPDLTLEPAAYRAVGEALLWLGELSPSRAHLEQGISLYDPAQHRTDRFLYGLDPGSAIRTFTAVALWLLGYPDQALKRIREAHSIAQESDHLPSLAHALSFAAWLSLFRREVHVVYERAEATTTLSTEQGFPLWVAMGHVFQGWSLTEQGKAADGIAQMRQGIAGWIEVGAELVWPYFTALLADVYGKVGRTEEGLVLLTEAMDVADKSGVRFWNAEVARLRGELTLQLGARDLGLETSPPSAQASSLKPLASSETEAEGYFLKAIEIAQRQQAKSLELRAATSLARLWQSQGKRTEAHELLSGIYAWFTEGFDTKDLQEAKALLEELS